MCVALECFVISLMELAEKFEWIASETEATAIVLERAHSEAAEKFFIEAKGLRERAERLRALANCDMKIAPQ
jgi:hypothetical protein